MYDMNKQGFYYYVKILAYFIAIYNTFNNFIILLVDFCL